MCAAAALALAACGGTTSEQVVSPSGVRCQIGLTAPAGELPSSGASLSLNVTVTRDCSWAASTDASWLTISPTSGQGAGVLSVALAANVRPSPRSASVVVNDSTIVLRQEPAPCRFELSHQGMRFGAEGGRTTVRISTIDGCEWRASGATEWLAVVPPAGSGTAAVDIEASRNTGIERTVTLTIAGSAVTVIQDAASGAPSGPGGPGTPGCTYAIDPDRATIRASAGESSIRVVTEPGCGWTAATGTSWLTVLRGSGTGPDTVTYQARANTSTVSERTGTVVAAGRTHRVTQRACELTLDHGSESPGVGPSGGSSRFAVVTDAGCTWSASTDVDWIVFIRSSGSGRGDVAYTVLPNPIERDRSGRITVSGRSIQVIQQALGQGG